MSRIIKVLSLILLSVFVLFAGPEIDPVQDAKCTPVEDEAGNPGGGVQVSFKSDTRLFLREGGCYQDYIADGQVKFVLSVDSAPQDSVTVESDDLDKTVSCTLYTPGARITIDAYEVGYGFLGSKELSVAALESLIEVYSSETEGPTGIGFDSTGKASAYSVEDSPATVDYFVSTDESGETTFLKSGERYSGGVRGVCSASESFDSLLITPSVSAATYQDSTAIAQGSVYSLYLDQGEKDYSTDDFFAKAYVTSIADGRVSLRIAYQPVPGLRWVVVEYFVEETTR